MVFTACTAEMCSYLIDMTREGDSTDPSSYRPIRITSLISNVNGITNEQRLF